MRAFADQLTLHLGKRRQDMEKEPARWGRGVDTLGDRTEVDAPLAQVLHECDQAAHRATEPVEPPHYQAITLAQV